MSAWIVSRNHIHVLVAHAIAPSRHGLQFRYPYQGNDIVVGPGDANRIGQVLTDACVEAVRARYGPPDSKLPGHADWKKPYRFPKDPAKVPAVSIAAVFKAIHCYEYQSCGADDWPESEARSICQVLEGFLVSKIPGYDEAPWGIE